MCKRLHPAVMATIIAAMIALPAAAADAPLDEATVRKLEQQCEVAREAQLKPIREAEIKRCIEEQGREPDYCQRYWRDYGNAVKLPNGRIQPRKFEDLPECAAAHQARRKLNMQ